MGSLRAAEAAFVSSPLSGGIRSPWATSKGSGIVIHSVKRASEARALDIASDEHVLLLTT